MAQVLRRWGLDHRSELDELAALRGQLTTAERERFDFEHSDDLERISPIFELVSVQCSGDPEVKAALDLAGFSPPIHRK